MGTHTIFLSRRNLQVLLSKLDRRAAGEQTACAIIKYRQVKRPDDLTPNLYQQTMEECMVVAVDDEEFYGQQKRSAGVMAPEDEVKLRKPSTGVV